MITGLISLIAALLFHPIFIGFIVISFLSCCVLLMTGKGTSFFRHLMYMYVLICLLFFIFLIWCVIGFGNSTPRTDPIPYFM